MMTRDVDRIVPAQPTSDGAGVKLRRAIGTHALDHVDPFLLLDEFRSDQPSDYLAGFPDHPHRGFETVTYMLAGAMEHRDSVGNHGLLRAGSLQWMTAGRGIIHSEMPRQEQGLMWGFQLWVNLPAKDKMQAPRYQDIAPESVPEATLPGGGRVRVLAGDSHGLSGPVRGVAAAPLLLDVALTAAGAAELSVPRGHAAVAYVFEGTARFGKHTVEAGRLVVFGDGDEVIATADSSGARVLVIAGKPIGEPVARRGPFVMNHAAELQQAFDDYRSGRLAR